MDGKVDSERAQRNGRGTDEEQNRSVTDILIRFYISFKLYTQVSLL